MNKSCCLVEESTVGAVSLGDFKFTVYLTYFPHKFGHNSFTGLCELLFSTTSAAVAHVYSNIFQTGFVRWNDKFSKRRIDCSCRVLVL